jgi:DHA1 family multidrug resistance protein-like MFS transporter
VKRRLVLPAGMLLGTVAWSFVMVSLPFHVRAISDVDAAATLRWTGWIVGITSLITVVTTPVWGRFGERYDPRRLFVAVQVLQGVSFVGMAAARTLGELFVSRFVLGFWGASSTFSFIIAGRERDPAETRRQVSYMQGAMTVGQVIGPLVGAMAAARLGFRPSFLVGTLILLATAAIVWLGVPAPPPARPVDARRGRGRHADVLVITLIVLGGSIQVLFLTSILPDVLPPLGVARSRTLEVGGVILFVSGVAAALGSMAAPRLADALPEQRLIPFLLGGSSLLLAALGLAHSVWLFAALRFLQVLFVSPVFPIVVARIAHRAGGEAIGIINSARIGAAFIGPVVATSLLAWAPASVLYACLGMAGAACVPLAWRRRPAARAA